MQFNDADSEHKILTKQNLATHECFNPVSNYLDQNPWSMMIGDTRGFIVIQDQLNEYDKTRKLMKSVATTISFNS